MLKFKLGCYSECTKPLSILWTQLWNSMGHLLVKRLKLTEEEKGQAGRPTACRPLLLRIFSSANSLMLPKLMFY